MELAHCPDCGIYILDTGLNDGNHHCRSDLIWLEAPAGSHITVDGTLCEPDGSQIHTRVHPEDPHSKVALLRALLADYDEGNATEASVDARLTQKFLDELFSFAKQGGGMLRFSSWCASRPPTSETIRLEFQHGEQMTEVRLIHENAVAK